MSTNAARRIVFILLVSLTVFFPIGIMVYKTTVLDYRMADLVPVVSYRVDVNFQVDGHGDSVDMVTYLPVTDFRQKISNEENSSGIFTLNLLSENKNRIATWQSDVVEGRHTVQYAYSVQAQHIRYVIPAGLEVPDSYARSLNEYLDEEAGIQVNDPLIEKTLTTLFPEKEPSILKIVTRLHRYLQDDFANKNFSGFTDALTTLKLGEASCNGKGRLFIALARKLNLPSRLVGGFIMNPGSKRTSHQWVEIYISGHWVPFDTINDHFAEIPENFLTLYYGDLVLFKHTSNINFQYFFKTNKKLVPRTGTKESLGDSVLNIFNFYSIFEKIGISQNLLKIIIMIPIGAFVVVVFRNVIGLETFGTFLPALIAAASRETGLLWGLVGFMLIIVITSLVRKLLDWVHLLHSPKMAILLTIVVIVMLLMTMFGVHFGLFDLAHISLFPIAILAITAERFAIIEAEQGLKESLRISFMTAIVIAFCYATMDSLFLQSMVLAFPEILLLVIALNLWLGKWVGMRVSEFIRFRKLIFKPQS